MLSPYPDIINCYGLVVNVMNGNISREALIEDVRGLSGIFENVHPDPYIRGGGKIAYHRRLQNLIKDIPQDGMTKEDFFYKIQSFVASLVDGHTNMSLVRTQNDRENPGGVPLYFEPIDGKLYVSSVTRQEHIPLIGALLVSIEDIIFTELVNRMKNFVGYENYYGLLGSTGRSGALFNRDSLKRLIPEWKNEGEIMVVLRHPDGSEREYLLPAAEDVKYPLLQPVSRIKFPDSKGWISYHFFDNERNIVYLRIDSMSNYREAHEYWHNVGMTQFKNYTNRVYTLYNGGEPPSNIEEVLNGIPSVTELFIEMLTEMREAESEYLIVDLRKCIGGFDAINTFFMYHLVGLDEALSQQIKRIEVRKLSEFLHKTSDEGIKLEDISYSSLVPLTLNDYDFSNDPQFTSYEKRKQDLENFHLGIFEKTPTFYRVFRTGEYERIYLPENIFVLCSSSTASSGYDMMINLKGLGAKIVGVPSGQSGNHFGNSQQFVLKNSNLVGYVSTKYFIGIPENPEPGHVLLPDYQLTYEKLASLGFDVNADLLYALEIIEDEIKGRDVERN
jgi:hypothetical protein